MNPVTVICLIIAIVAIAAALWMYLLMYRTRRLRNRFGPEYDHTLAEAHGRVGRAETLLEQRQRRVNKLNIRPLSREEGERFAAEWRSVQERFVDDPRSAVALADTIVNHALQARNYPMTDFEQRAADISVEHPQVVHDYRVAHDIALSDPHHEVSTEDLRQAMQHYRKLFQELVETPLTHHEEVTDERQQSYR
jgi:hypothetical protein